MRVLGLTIPLRRNMKILIVKRDKLGDMIVTTPMLRVLRTALPDAEIHLLAAEYNLWVVDGNTCIDQRWSFGRARTGKKIHWGAALGQLKLYLHLKREKFDFAIAAGGEASHRALSRTLHAGAKRTVGYATDAKWRAKISDSLKPDEREHESVRIARLLEPLGVSLPDLLPDPEFIPPASGLAFADQWLADEKIAPQTFWVLGIGSRIPNHQPNTEQILRWARWAKESRGLETVFMWTPGAADHPLYPGDDAIAEPVLAAGMPYIHAFRGGLKEAIGLIWRANTSLFPNSGLMHFASTSPGGVLGLLANADVWDAKAQWKPIGSRARYVETRGSAHAFTDAEVFAQIDDLLGR